MRTGMYREVHTIYVQKQEGRAEILILMKKLYNLLSLKNLHNAQRTAHKHKKIINLIIVAQAPQPQPRSFYK